MPKKRYHQARYSKPQSTAPASLSISSGWSRRNSQHQHDETNRGVNELLADLRRTRLGGGGGAIQRPVEIPPTLPPVLRDILQLPELPALRPRRPDRRRTHAGPPAPRSWLSGADRAAGLRKLQQYGRPGDGDHRPLPGMYRPAEGSLIDIVLRRVAFDWEFQREYGRYYLYDLPKHLREALVTYLGIWNSDGVSVEDLNAVLLPPPMEEGDEEYEHGRLSPSSANEYFTHLDLTGSLGRSLKLKELGRFLFPSRLQQPTDMDTRESWDAPEDISITVPRPLLPNLTHLSLGIRPDCAQAVSWRQLLGFVAHCPTLTHLSLAFWPEPSLTPNAKLASFVTAQGRTVPYSGTGPYSHSLDNDWSEAIVVLRRLSKTLYGLEYLDLTGCGDWYSTLWSTVGHETIDWVGDWGKISTLLLYPGYQLSEEAGPAEKAKYWETAQNAERVERHIASKRAGRGRFITVETAKRSQFG
ncbi:hypothetical protein QBC34DRAFT_298270 [Podospora aff. communis PSN243]|uniref:Tafazzin n=1 Tax=Podospora aff. communis PSN243 TaxID=3040156 RepID=A0AAV9GNW5_9PEZI|nr:hypothetical protein QBC34DRAFT_298270 [Podospora aff. communis PSN243]